MVEDLWPDFPIEKETSPVDILREQAAVLTKKTKNQVEGRVVTTAAGDRIESDFLLLVPALGSYKYRLFTLSHGAISYPAEIRGFSFSPGAPVEVEEVLNEEDLRRALKLIFNDQGTRRVITSLMAHSRAPEKQHSMRIPAAREA